MARIVVLSPWLPSGVSLRMDAAMLPVPVTAPLTFRITWARPGPKPVFWQVRVLSDVIVQFQPSGSVLLVIFTPTGVVMSIVAFTATSVP